MRDSDQMALFVMPRIVLYPTHNKADAEKMLGWLHHQVLPHHEEIGIVPRFNKSISSLIYWLQSHADHQLENFKKEENLFDPKNGYTTIDIDKIQKRAPQSEHGTTSLQLYQNQDLQLPSASSSSCSIQ